MLRVPAVGRNAEAVRPGEQDGSKTSPRLRRPGRLASDQWPQEISRTWPPRCAATLVVPQLQPSERGPARTAETLRSPGPRVSRPLLAAAPAPVTRLRPQPGRLRSHWRDQRDTQGPAADPRPLRKHLPRPATGHQPPAVLHQPGCRRRSDRRELRRHLRPDRPRRPHADRSARADQKRPGPRSAPERRLRARS